MNIMRLMMTCVLLFAAVVSQSPAAEPKRGGRVIISSGIGVPLHFNPAVASGSAIAMVGTQIFASPLRYDDNWNPKPYLARSWEFSKDGLSLTLNLVKGATFHDGHPITSADVAFSILTVQRYHPFKSMFAPVERVDTPDPHTAVIRLSRPHPAILLSMSPALLPILPKHIYGDGRDIKTHPANLQPVGSGPFKLAKYVAGKYLVLKRNERFFIRDVLIWMKSFFDLTMIPMRRWFISNIRMPISCPCSSTLTGWTGSAEMGISWSRQKGMRESVRSTGWLSIFCVNRLMTNGYARRSPMRSIRNSSINS